MLTPGRLSRIPWGLLLTAGALIVLGWVGIARSEAFREALTGVGGRYLRQQVVHSVLAVIVVAVVGAIDYRRWQPAAYLIYGLSLVLLAAVYCFPSVNGAQRWIRFGPFSLQPSELAKLALVVALSRYLMLRESYRRFRGLFPPLLLTLVPLLLILREPDLGTALLLAAILLAMLVVAGARRSDLGRLLLLALCVTPVVWSQMSREQRSRITALFDQPPPGVRANSDAYHLQQSKQMMALGDTWGSLARGDASEDPAAYALPEARTDFIFAVLGERIGLWGQGLVLLLFAGLVYRGAGIARDAREPFGRLVASGVVAIIAVQVVVNTGMAVGLLPVTGLALPLVSYGGSALLTNALGVGLLVSVAIHRGYEVANEPFRWQIEGD